MALAKIGQLNYEECGWDYWWEYLTFPTLTDPDTGRAYSASISLANTPEESAGIQWRNASGYAKSRLKEASQPNVLMVSYEKIKQSVFEEVKDFEKTWLSIGESKFNWTDPSSGVEGTYKLLQEIQGTMHAAEGSLWDISMKFEEVI